MKIEKLLNEYLWNTISIRDISGDILIEVPESRTGIVVEIKYAEDAAFDSACNKAIQQIEEKHYEAALHGDGMENVVKYGIACYRKRSKVLLAE